MKRVSCNEFRYDHTDSKWIDVDCIISSGTMSYNVTNEVCTLDRIRTEELEKFVIKRNV